MIKRMESKVTLKVSGKPINFLLDTGAAYSVLTSYRGPLSSDNSITVGVDGMLSAKHFTPPSHCLWGMATFAHQLLVMAECSTPLLGADILSKVRTLLFSL